MPVKKCHRDHSPCPLAGSLDIFGDHWTLLVIRDLMVLGRHEFKEMLAAPEGISTNILTDRLAQLTKEGLIASVVHPESKRRKLYYLTEEGKSLFPVMAAISSWRLRGVDSTRLPEHLTLIAEGKLKLAERLVMKKLALWEKEFLTA